MNRFRILRKAGVIALSLATIVTSTPVAATEAVEEAVTYKEESAQPAKNQSAADQSASESQTTSESQTADEEQQQAENSAESAEGQTDVNREDGTSDAENTPAELNGTDTGTESVENEGEATETTDTENTEAAEYSEYTLSEYSNSVKYNGVDSYDTFYFTPEDTNHYSITIASNALLSYYCGQSALDNVYLYDVETGAVLAHFSSEVSGTTQLSVTATLKKDQKVSFNLPGTAEDKEVDLYWRIYVSRLGHTQGEILYYVTNGGHKYQTYEEIPCKDRTIQYSYYYECQECGELVKEDGYKYHSWEDKEYYVGDTVYSSYEEIPCDTAYQTLQVCSNCGEEEKVEGYKRHSYDVFLGYTDSDNNVYGEEEIDSIPHGADVTATYKCNTCGQEFSDICKHWNLWAGVISYTDSDQNTYSNVEDIPCGTVCSTVYGCMGCGETLDEETIENNALEL